MKKLLVFVLALSVLGIGASAIAQDNMGKGGSMAAAPVLKSIKGTVKFEGDKATFVTDKDQKSWDVVNPDALKGHDGHHVIVTAHIYPDKGAIHVMSVKMAQ